MRAGYFISNVKTQPQTGYIILMCTPGKGFEQSS